MEHLHKICCQN